MKFSDEDIHESQTLSRTLKQ